MSGNLLLALMQLVLAIVSTLVSIILLPFSWLIQQFLPEFDSGLNSIAGYYEYASTYMSWIINALGLPAIVITMVAGYYIFTWTITFSVWAVKLLISWKKALWA